MRHSRNVYIVKGEGGFSYRFIICRQGFLYIFPSQDDDQLNAIDVCNGIASLK